MNMPPWLLPVLLAPFIGSFLSVVITRLPAGRGIVWGRSHCPACGEALSARDLVPLLSWLAARGRCRQCGGAISPFYPAIELAALAVALWAAASAEGWVLWVSCGLGWTLLALAVIDARDGILPDALTLPLIPCGLAVSYLGDPGSLLPHAIGATAGFAAFALIGGAYRCLRGRDGLGLGDAKLMAAAGAFLSWDALPSVTLIGALASLAWIVLSRIAGRAQGPLRADTRLAFGPGLCLATWLVWLYGPLSLAS